MNWKSIVASVAPTIGTALGGPLGGMATKAIAGALLGEEDQALTGKDLDKKIAAVVENNPDALLKLKEADQAFDSKMRELDIDLERIAADDRADARDMQKQTKTWVVPVLAALTVGGFFATVGFVLVGEIPKDNTLVGVVIGAVSTKAEQVYNFFFGSSQGSKDKTLQMGGAK